MLLTFPRGIIHLDEVIRLDGGIINCANKIIAICEAMKALPSNDSAFSDYWDLLLGKLQRLSLQIGLDDEREDAKLSDVAWITVKGTHTPLKDGVAVGGPLEGSDFSDAEQEKAQGGTVTGKNISKNYGSPYPIEEISAEGENKPCKGFTKRNLRIHKDKRHPEQYAHMTDAQYEEHAKKLLQKKCGPDILGYRCADGSVCRFNRLTGEYAKGYPGGNIKSCFFPTKIDSTDRTKIDLDFARRYFEEKKREESYD